MQPYFFPYIGYFQLIAAVDQFIIYDNIKYTKKGWINRNRILRNGEDTVFSLPLERGSDALMIVERRLAPDFSREKLLNQIRGAYSRAPHFSEAIPVIEKIVRYHESNLFDYLRHAIVTLCAHFSLRTQITTSSEIQIDHTLTKEQKVIALCVASGARTYINAIGGLSLYEPRHFEQQGIELRFLKSKPVGYSQFGEPFVPWLSMIDVMMFNPLRTIELMLSDGYDLLEAQPDADPLHQAGESLS